MEIFVESDFKQKNTLPNLDVDYS